MERPEVPTEHLHEELHHQAHKGDSPTWTMGVALSSALLAGLAAVSSLLAGHHVNEAMIDNIKAANQWSRYQSKSIKANLVESKLETLAALGKPEEPKEKERLARYAGELKEIEAEARKLEKAAHVSLHKHEIQARSVTMFQVAIAVAAIAVLTKLVWFWWVGLGFGMAGIFFFIQGLLVGGAPH